MEPTQCVGWPRLAWLVVVVSIGIASDAHAQSGYQGYPVAPRALGMGGAITALAEGAGTLYYNPAGLAYGEHAELRVSGNLYGIHGATMNGAIGGGRADFRYMNIQVVPANMSFEIHGIKLGKINVSKRWGFGLSVLAPYAFAFDAVAENKAKGSIILRDADDLTYSIYAGFGYRVRKNLSLGISLVGVFRQYSARFNFTYDSAGRYASGSGELQTSTLGHSIAFGLRYNPREHLWLGLGLHLPLQHLASFNSTERTRLALFEQVSPDGQFVGATLEQSRKLDARYVIPLRLNIGFAWEVTQRWAIACGLYFWMPHDYNAAVDKDTHEVISVNRHAFTVNATLGAEVYLPKQIALRFGVYTDRSPLAKVTADSGLGDKVDLYGGTLSVGFRGKRSTSELGVVGAAGPVRGIGIDLLGGSFTTQPLDGTRWQVHFSYATSTH